MKPQVCQLPVLHRQHKLPPLWGRAGVGATAKNLSTTPLPSTSFPDQAEKTMETGESIQPETITGLIHYIRGEKVILDYDLASLYGVEVKYQADDRKKN